MVLLISILSFGVVALLFMGLAMRTEREIIQERIREGAVEKPEVYSSVEIELQRPIAQRIILPILAKLARLASGFTPAGSIRAVEEKLETAGRPWGLGATEFAGLKVVSIGVFTVLGVVGARWLDGSAAVQLLFLALFVFIGLILPNYLLQRAIDARQSEIRKVLADTLDLLTVSVEAGLGLDGAMQKVVEKMHTPLSEEMRRALNEMRVGKIRAEALRDMAKRVKVSELSAFVAAICQADQLGVSIAKVLRVQGDTLRTQRSQRAREAGAKLPVKMLVPLVFCIFPALFVVILGPAVVSIYRALGIGFGR